MSVLGNIRWLALFKQVEDGFVWALRVSMGPIWIVAREFFRMRLLVCVVGGMYLVVSEGISTSLVFLVRGQGNLILVRPW